MGKVKKNWVQEEHEKTVDECMSILIGAMRTEAGLTESDFKDQQWQKNPWFQNASEIKEVEDGNQSIQSIESNDHSDAESK